MSDVRRVSDIENFPPEYKAYNTQYPGPKEVVGWMLWGHQIYVSAATLQLTLFNRTHATLDDGNMEVAGQLSAPKGFFLRSIRFFPKFLPQNTANAAAGATQTGILHDMAQLLNTGTLRLVVGSKEYVHVPLWMLPQGGGPVPIICTGDVAVIPDYATNGIADPRAVYSLAKPLFIAPQMSFFVTLTWPAAITLVAGDTDVMVALEGDMVRPIQ